MTKIGRRGEMIRQACVSPPVQTRYRCGSRTAQTILEEARRMMLERGLSSRRCRFSS